MCCMLFSPPSPPHTHTQAQLNEQLDGLQTLTAVCHSKLEETSFTSTCRTWKRCCPGLLITKGVVASNDYDINLLVNYLPLTIIISTPTVIVEGHWPACTMHLFKILYNISYYEDTPKKRHLYTTRYKTLFSQKP